MGVNVDPLTCVRRETLGMLWAADAGIVSKSAEGLAKIVTVIAAVFEEAVLTVSEKKTETMLLRTPDQAPRTSPLVIEAAGQRNRQETRFLYVGGLQRKRRHYARDQTTGPTRMGMLQTVQAGAVRYGGRAVHSSTLKVLIYGR